MAAPAFDQPLRPVRKDTTVFVHIHDYGLLTLRPLHDLDPEVHERLLEGETIPFIETLPLDVQERLSREQVHEVVRFFTAWIHAGYDFELAAWSAWLSLVDTLPALGREDGGEEVPPAPLAVASVLADDVDEIGNAIAERWQPRFT